MTNSNGKPVVLVTGATGKVGQAVVAALRSKASVEVRSGVRNMEKAKDLGTALVSLDFDKPESFADAMTGVDTAFLATGYTIDMLVQSKAFIDAARRTGVKSIVHLGACGDDETLVPHWAWHQFVERYIEWSGLGFTHLRPEFFMQNLLGYGQRRVIVNGELKAYVGDARASWVDCDDVALVAAECLTNPQAHNGKTYRLGNDSKSYAEIAEVLTRVVGQPFSYVSRPTDDFLKEVLAAGAEPCYMRSVQKSHRMAVDRQIANPDAVFDNFFAITGKHPTTWESFAQKHRDAFAY